MSHAEKIHREAENVVCAMSELWPTHASSPWQELVSAARLRSTLMATIRALANHELACDEEREDRLAAYSEHARSELYTWLYEHDACGAGLAVVGADVTYATLDLVLAHRPDWREWYDAALAERDCCEHGECDCDA